MSGVRIAGALLRANAPFLAIVPLASVKAWKLRQNTQPPSAVATRISRTKLQLLDAQDTWLVTERVQITIRARSGDQREKLIRLGERACVDKFGTIGGFENVSVISSGAGPDFEDDSGTVFMGSFDLRVSFNEPA
ncbi:hypothetical protein O4H52_07890 [Sphingomonadaceae bacterium G21617-S1]|nr:hypothetical protein [Sphingomonadaceae bacterium G21617-S1]